MGLTMRLKSSTSCCVAICRQLALCSAYPVDATLGVSRANLTLPIRGGSPTNRPVASRFWGCEFAMGLRPTHRDENQLESPLWRFYVNNRIVSGWTIPTGLTFSALFNA